MPELARRGELPQLVPDHVLAQIFVKGEVIKTVPESQIVETLIEEAMKIAETMEDAGVTGAPEVKVTR